MISQQINSSKSLLISLTLSLFSVGAFANGDPSSFLKFSTDFDAKCVTRGGVMIYISNTHSTGKIKVLLERWYMDNRTADRGRSVLMPGGEPEALGCSLVSNGKQEWKVLKCLNCKCSLFLPFTSRMELRYALKLGCHHHK